MHWAKSSYFEEKRQEKSTLKGINDSVRSISEAESGLAAITDVLKSVDDGLKGADTFLRSKIDETATAITKVTGTVNGNKASLENAKRDLAALSVTMKSVIAQLTALAGVSSDVYTHLDMPTHIEVSTNKFKVVRNVNNRDRMYKSRASSEALYGTGSSSGFIIGSCEDILPNEVELLVTAISDEKTSGTLTDFIASNPGDKVTSVKQWNFGVDYKMATNPPPAIPDETFQVPVGATSTVSNIIGDFVKGVLLALDVAEVFGWEVSPELGVALTALEGIATTVEGAINTIEGFRRGNPSDNLNTMIAAESISLSREAPRAMRVKTHTHAADTATTVLIVNSMFESRTQLGNRLGGVPQFANFSQFYGLVNDMETSVRTTTESANTPEVAYDRGLLRETGYRVDYDNVETITGIIKMDKSLLHVLHGGVSKVVLVPRVANFTVPVNSQTVYIANQLYAHRSATNIGWTYKNLNGDFSMLRTAYQTQGWNASSLAQNI